MAEQIYKIFINGHTIVLTNNNHFANNSNCEFFNEKDLSSVVQQLCSGVYSGKEKLVFQTVHTGQLFKELRSKFKFIKAAGGIVFNEYGELLLIKRLGKWDLPKGKLEEKEDQRLAALREVHEECGLNFLGILHKVSNTYHAYFLKGRWILKRSAWYRMVAWGDVSVTPQLEEDITEVVWVDEEFIRSPDFETYDSLNELFQNIDFPRNVTKK